MQLGSNSGKSDRCMNSKSENKEDIEICKININKDLQIIYEIINDAATAYRGTIPDDRWKEPYMQMEELIDQIKQHVEFWKYLKKGETVGVMGIQDKGDVTLIRHAYVKTSERSQGIGSSLLHFLMERTNTPILIGTWAAASWAIDFYTKHGFRLVNSEEKTRLLQQYWDIPSRQAETSVVLASKDWFR